MHEHTPFSSKNAIVRCLYLFISPVRLFHYYTEGTDICVECGVHISLPSVYYGALSSILYFLSGVAIYAAMSILPYLEIIVGLLLMIMFHHVFSSVVLGYFPWENYDPSVRSARAFSKDAKNELTKKFIYHAVGLYLGLLVHMFIKSI